MKDILDILSASGLSAEVKSRSEKMFTRLAEAEAVAQENERLKSLVALAESEIEPVAVTRLVGSSATSSRRFAYIGKGRLHGIEVGMPVRRPRGG